MNIAISPYSAAPVVQSVHSLIHPLYSGDPEIMRLSNTAMQSRLFADSLKLSERFKSVAAHLPPPSMMCMFIHTSESVLEERRDQYADALRGFIESMKAILGGRLFITYGYRGDTSKVSYEASHHLTNRILASGLDVHDEPSSYVYGESFGFCVHESAIVMRDVWALSDPVRILVRLTDMWRQWFRLDDHHQEILRKRHAARGLLVEECLPRDIETTGNGANTYNT